MTRWSLRDLTEKVLKAQGYDVSSDKWEVIEFPALMPSGKPCWPEYWNREELEGVRASLSAAKWNAQWQQNPVSEEGAIIKKEWWQRWEPDEVPQLEYVIQSYDTAFSRRETADYSAITTWGVFYPKQDGPANLILLDSKKGRWDFPELKNRALDQYNFWEPETVIIEAKASGMPLTQELRQLGIPVVNFTPSKGNDKLTRVHSVSPLFESGMIWAPDERWADEVIEECAAFPNGDHDDLVDSTTQALMRYRQGNFVQLPSDDWVDEEPSTYVRSYYG
jgi:predicted phage terminase large subunit-like protein